MCCQDAYRCHTGKVIYAIKVVLYEFMYILMLIYVIYVEFTVTETLKYNMYVLYVLKSWCRFSYLEVL